MTETTGISDNHWDVTKASAPCNTAASSCCIECFEYRQGIADTICYARLGTYTRNSGMSGSRSMNVPFFFPFTVKRRIL